MFMHQCKIIIRRVSGTDCPQAETNSQATTVVKFTKRLNSKLNVQLRIIFNQEMFLFEHLTVAPEYIRFIIYSEHTIQWSVFCVLERIY